MDLAVHLDDLPAELRLALAYAPQRSRGLWLGLFALDVRLAGIVRQTSEPMLGQIRLAWWRDRLKAGDAATISGEPLFELLSLWGPQRSALAALVDGWEVLLDDAELTAAALARFADGRAAACEALAQQLGEGESAALAARAGQGWALAEIALKLSDPAETARAQAAAAAYDWQAIRLPRALRPLQVLHGLARRKQGAAPLLDGPADGLAAVRLGLLGF
jgi:phytoene synthase